MKNPFITRDLYAAGFLYAKGAGFEKIERNGKVCWFVFGNKELCEQLQLQFFAKTGDVVAKDYADALRTLKDLVFSN